MVEYGTDDWAKEKIVEAVTNHNGCKLAELPTLLPVDYWTAEETRRGVVDLVTDLIHEGQLIEIEYELTVFPGRIRSFLLPGDAVIHSHYHLYS